MLVGCSLDIGHCFSIESPLVSSLIRQGAGDKRGWDVRFIRGPNDWEVELVDDFFRFLAANLPSANDGDRMSWKLTKNVCFNIRSFYHKLHGSSNVFPWKGIWKVKAPQHVSFFVWTVTWDRILTGDNLWSRGFDFDDWCIMCLCGETVDHLLLHYGKAHC